MWNITKIKRIRLVDSSSIYVIQTSYLIVKITKRRCREYFNNMCSYVKPLEDVLKIIKYSFSVGNKREGTKDSLLKI